MIATIHFFLPEDNEEYKMVTEGWKYHSCLWDMYNYFRSKLKYEDLSDVEYSVLEKAQEKFFEILEENDVSLH